jgi:multidrug efflux pump subunit AcrA (membrane-fusion protein)
MCSDSPETGHPAAEPTLREIDTLIEAIAELSKAPLPREEFYHEFLRSVVSALAAAGGIVWTRDDSGNLLAAYRFGFPEAADSAEIPFADWHRSCAAWVSVHDAATAVAPRCTVAPDSLQPNPTDWLLLFCPWKVEGESTGAVEILQRPGAGPSLERGYLRFLEVACQLLADYHRNLLLRDLRGRAAQWGRIESFSRQVHASLDLVPTAYAIANEGRQLLGCDRVSVLVRRRSKYEAVAISGTDSFNRRSNSVCLMERVTAAVLASGDGLWFPAGEKYPPQIEEHLDAYLDESHTRGLGILPLRNAASSEPSSDRDILGGLVVERFYGPADEPFRTNAAALTAHSALAIQNALAFERLPLRRMLRRLGAMSESLRGRRLTLAVGLVAVVIAAVAALVLVSGDFTVEARGELQPSRTYDVFAPDDGVVWELRARSGTRVEANQVLLSLRKPELDLEVKRVWGELETARKKLAAVESEQLLNRREDVAQRRLHTEQTAQQEELRAMIAGLESQHVILRHQQAELQVRSPIAGEVLTWNAEQLLAARPVARGQVLLAVADLAGPWNLELRVPERRMLHLAEARRQTVGPLDVSFALATNPAQVLWGKLDRVGSRTEITESEGAVVWATVNIDAADVAERLPGAGVVARIYCGRRAIGYVWLHDLIDFVRTWVLF